MAHVMRSRLSKESQIPSLNSSSLTVFCTGNFWRVMARMEGQNLDDYLRPVDAILVFENESLLLLSEREADRVLRAFATAKKEGRIMPDSPKLMHFTYTGLSSEDEVRVDHNPLMKAAVLGTKRLGDSKSLASVWIFAGRTTIPERGRGAVEALIKGAGNAVRHLVASRGKKNMLPRSDLERLLG